MSEHLFDLFRLELLADLAPEYLPIENFHIFLQGQCGNTFIMSVDCSTEQRYTIFPNMDNTLLAFESYNCKS